MNFNNPQFSAMQQQQAQQQQQQQQRGGGSGMNPLSMMQQQQQQQPHQGNMMGYGGNAGGWNGGMNNNSVVGNSGGGNNPGSSMDASTGSSARLMAMANLRMGMPGGSSNNLPGQQQLLQHSNSHSQMGNSSSSNMQNMQLLLQQQQQASKNSAGGGGGGFQNGMFPQDGSGNHFHNNNNSMNNSGTPNSTHGNAASSQQIFLQQQLATLQKQMQSQQQQQRGGMQGNGGMMGQTPTASSLLQHQHQLLHQMQQQRGNGGPAQLVGSNTNNMQGDSLQGGGASGNMMGMMSGGSSVNGGNGGLMSTSGTAGMRNSLAAGSGGPGSSMTGGNPFLLNHGSLNEQQLRLHQQNLLRASAGQSSMDGDNQDTLRNMNQQSNSTSSAPHGGMSQQLMGQQQQQMQSQNLQGGSGNNSMFGNMSSPGISQVSQQGYSGMHDQRSSSVTSQPQQQMGSQTTSQQHGSSGLDDTPNQLQQSASDAVKRTSFLDGSFAGGWQSNADLPDRRRVIFSILEVIRRIRPDDSGKMSSKLPHMAKSLEEHLYRSAQTKEEYMDFNTLKERLQAIAHGLELHRSTSSSSMNMSQSGTSGGMNSTQQGHSLSMQNQSNNGMSSSPQTNFGAHNNPQSQSSIGNNGNWNMGAQGGQLIQSGGMNNMMMNNQGSSGMSGMDIPGSSNSQRNLSSQSGFNNLSTSQSGNFGNQQSHSDDNWNNPEGNLNSGNSTSVASAGMHGLMRQSSSMSNSNTNQQSGYLNGGSSTNMMNNDQQGSSQRDDFMNSSLDLDGWSSTFGNDSNMPPPNTMGGLLNPDYPNTPKYQDAAAAQKKKVILQQQQRLLLLRHASKCRAGPSCSTKFCAQMVTLWKHMKTCRDKNCKTSHCLSSRCVLNHYRICKSNGKTATCEVCGPVMLKIKQQETDDGSLVDPLVMRSQDLGSLLQGQMPSPHGSVGMGDTMSPALSGIVPQQQGNMMNMGMQQPQMNDTANNQMNYMQLGQDGNTQSPMINQMDMSTQGQQSQNDPTQLQQLQAQQMKLQTQLDSLQQLQKQQEQLLEQQLRLQEQSQQIKDPNSQQAQQLQQQQLLLKQLQKRCQQQQMLLQRDIQIQSRTTEMSRMQQSQMQQIQAVAQSQNNANNPLPPQSVPTPNVNELNTDQPHMAKKRLSGLSSTGGKGKRLATKGKRAGRPKSNNSIDKSDDSISISSDKVEEVKKRSSVTMSAKERSQKKIKNEELSAILETNRPVMAPSTQIENSPNTSLIYSMSKDSIKKHLDSLNKKIRLSSRTVTHKCMPLIQELIDNQFGWVFHDAVDPVALGLPDYLDVVKTPMHLELVKKKLENAIYSDMDAFEHDVKLVFENAILYNGETSEVGGLAQTMLDTFHESYTKMVQGVEISQQNLEKNGEACSLCGTQKRKFEPTVLYCQGQCGMQRIKRHAPYYTDRSKANHWCQDCYNQIDHNDSVVLDDGSEVTKKELLCSNNDALPEEAWVNCDECQSWVHQICALFNGRINKSNAKFTCPSCHLKKEDTSPLTPSDKDFVKGADQLPHCKMSISIENGLHVALNGAYEQKARDLGISVDTIEKASGLSVRVVSNVDKQHFVRDEMIRRYSNENCPTVFPVRSKCVALFQKIHGADTLLFSMYVYEYGQNCPAPNRRRVYISYLDSVQYFEPKCYRTLAYHAILIEYLRFVKERGFHTAHIWSCPPTPGDDYIFYCHPSHQLTPREDMLRSWYGEILEKAKAQGVVIRTTTLFDEYFSKDGIEGKVETKSNPTCLPYFEGDYIPGEIENIIRIQRKSGKVYNADTEDEVMRRLGHNLGKMKDNFIVVHLRNRRFALAVERGEDVSKWKEDSDDEFIRSKRAKIGGKDSSILYPSNRLEVSGPDVNDDSAETDSQELAVPGLGKQPLAMLKEEILHDQSENSTASSGSKKAARDKDREVKAADKLRLETKTEGRSEKDEGIDSGVSRHFSSLNRSPRTVADTADEDSPIESEMFESRQQFLNYCQANHCQFDELRRSKHSSMMVLFQLHNPLAPKFLQQCSICYRDISHGTRYHCNDCSNFDLCQDCYEPIKTGQWTHRDNRFAHDKGHTFSPVDTETCEDNPKNREDRQKSLQAHLELLDHTGSCEGPPNCSLQNCQRMKKLFEHVRNCEVKPKKDCKICLRLLSLCAVHSRMCTVNGECAIPFCDRIRERNLRLRRQQQLMDDRRRVAQNELYHAGGES